MSAVDDLREAAKQLRELAAAATSGPWKTEYFGDRGYPQRVTNDRAEVVAECYEGGLAGRKPTPEYVASLHPLVGLALADALEHLARLDPTGKHPLVRLSRLYLGRAET